MSKEHDDTVIKNFKKKLSKNKDSIGVLVMEEILLQCGRKVSFHDAKAISKKVSDSLSKEPIIEDLKCCGNCDNRTKGVVMKPDSSLTEVLKELYILEINVSIYSFWDAGYTFRIIKDPVDFHAVAIANGVTIEEGVEFLREYLKELKCGNHKEVE